MIKTIFIDDEKPALSKMRNLLKSYTEYEICGEFTDANEALNQIAEISPQVAFIDIAMPGMSGIELATAINKKMGHKVQIVFVTAHNEYALPAFDIWATDYLLKPVSRTRFDKTIQRLNSILMVSTENSHHQDKGIMVHLFGKLEVSLDGKVMENWRTAKVRELFAYFLHNRNRSIYRDTLLEALWEDMNPHQALSNLNTTNYYLRRHLEKCNSDIAILYDSGYYNLDLGSSVCDVDEFEKVEIMADIISEKNLNQVLSGAALYRGRYFEDVKCTWADLERERYASRYVRLRTLIAEYYLKTGRPSESIEQAMLSLEVNRLNKDAWKILLAAYHQKGDPTLLRRAQENMRRAYLEYTGKEPPFEIQ